MVGCTHLELPSLRSNDGDFQQVPQTLFEQPTLISFVRFKDLSFDTHPGSYEPLHS